jgi:putative phosphoribosyl transferase
METVFQNRREAGRQLAQELEEYAHRNNVIVLALPRGGVPVAFEIAQFLEVPMDILLVRKLGVPGHEELAMGAIASGGIQYIDQQMVEQLGVEESWVQEIANREQQKIDRQTRIFRDDLPLPEIRDQIVIVVDDGMATGSTMRAAVRALREQHPQKIVIAVPVTAPSSYLALRDEADEIVAVLIPQSFYAVGQWYNDFSQTSDEEVKELLEEARRRLESKTRDALQAEQEDRR